MTYAVKVEPALAREELVAEAARDAKLEPFYEYQNGPRDMPVVDLPIGLPIYRMANYRTRIVQQSYIRREGLAPDYFSAGEENEAAQQRQHEFLLKYAHEGRKGSVTPIFDVLQKSRQTLPILITSRGVVVNGNRRLAAMRSLFQENPEKYAHFSHVKCQVLPASATQQDIREVEVRLQMKQRTDLEYEWINECVAIKDLRDSEIDAKRLAAIMNKPKGDIDKSLNALIEADLYLSEWLGRPGDYEEIQDAKQLFYDMGDNISGKSGEAQEISRRIAWLLADRRRALGRRVYDYKPMFGKKADEVASKLADRFAVEVTEEEADEDDDDSFDIDISGGEQSSLRPLIELMDDPTRREEIGTDLVDICAGIVGLDKEQALGQVPLNQVQKANSLLSEVDLTKAAPTSLDAIDRQLGAIITQVERLRGVVSRQKARAAGADA